MADALSILTGSTERRFMRKNHRVLLEAEQQLAFGRAISDVTRARNALRLAVPDCLLLELLDTKILRMRAAENPPISPWAA
jgi:hypothetical protein